MESLTIVLLGIIAYQLYLVLKIANKTTETFASEEYSTLYPVFTPREVQWQHDEWKYAQKRCESSFERLRKTEREELLEHKRLGKLAAEFKPSHKLLIILEGNSENISVRNHHHQYRRHMIEANIATLNGTPINAAKDEALKYAYLPIDAVRKDFKDAVTQRKEYWRDHYDSIIEDDHDE